MDYAVANAFGYTAGASVNVLNINGGTVGGANVGNHFWNNFQLNMTGGTLWLGGTLNEFHSPTITVNSSSDTAQIVPVTGNAVFRLRDSTSALFQVADGDQDVDLLVSAPITANGTNHVTKAGVGTLLLTGNNTYIGNTTINAGTLQVSAPGGRLYNGGYNNSAVLQVNTSGTLVLDSFAYGAAGGTGQLSDYRQRRVLNGGTIRVLGNTHSSGNNFTVTSLGGTFESAPSGQTLTLNGNGNGNLQLDGPLSIGGSGNITVNEQFDGPGSLTKTGDGTLTLSGPNTYTGTTTVSTGTLRLAGGAAIADTGAVLINGGVLDVTAAETIGSLAGTVGTSVTLGGNTLTIGDDTNSTYAGSVNGTAGGLIKQGGGEFTLSGTNTYTGTTTVSEGTLLVNGSITSDTTVNDGATLGGTGSINGNVTAAGTGTVNPGNSPGTLTVTGNYSASTTFEVNSPYLTAGLDGDYDQIVVDGAANKIDLNSATITFVSSGG